jgi:flagellar motility protein MotE (MotC chaperone)
MIGRLRLIDAVAIAAGAMLFLKVLGIATGSHASDTKRRVGPANQVSDTRRNPDSFGSSGQPRPFAEALSRARTNFVPEVQTTGSVPKPEEPQAATAPTPIAPETLSEPVAVPPSASERALLERLGERRNEWQQKGKDIEMRERLLENAERKLEARINDLKAAEEKVETAKRSDPEAGGLRNLVVMYEAMKPKEAARVFDRLSHDVLVPVVLQMNPRKMAEVLAVMTPEAAERLTVALAVRAKGKVDAPIAVRPGPALPPSELQAIEQPTPRR